MPGGVPSSRQAPSGPRRRFPMDDRRVKPHLREPDTMVTPGRNIQVLSLAGCCVAVSLAEPRTTPRRAAVPCAVRVSCLVFQGRRHPVSSRAHRLQLQQIGLRAVIRFHRCVLAWLGRSAPLCFGLRRVTFGSPHRRACERRALLAAPPFRRAGLRARIACQELASAARWHPVPAYPSASTGCHRCRFRREGRAAAGTRRAPK
jgi:hypothetical protein